jgi:hypothetical protein
MGHGVGGGGVLQRHEEELAEVLRIVYIEVCVEPPLADAAC